MYALTATNRPDYQGPVVVIDQKPRQPSTLDVLDLLSFLMDRWFELPGTRLRFGLNSLLLFVPVLGDALASVVSFAILAIGLSHYRVPRIVALRMVLNSLLDTTLSPIPVLGNLFDVYFKADTRNVALLRECVVPKEGPPPSTWRHWAFVVVLLMAFVVVLGLVLFGAVALVVGIVRLLSPTS